MAHQIRAHTEHRNTDAEPFTCTTTTEILAKVRCLDTNVRQLVENNAK